MGKLNSFLLHRRTNSLSGFIHWSYCFEA